MEFDSRYCSGWERKGSYTYQLPKENSTILPFFGFSYEIEKDTHYKAVGGGLEISLNNAGDIDVRKTPKLLDSDTYERAVFQRVFQPMRCSSKAIELEDKFYALIKDKYTTDGVFDPFKTHFIDESLDSYYSRRQRMKVPELSFRTIILASVGVAVVCFIILIAALLSIQANPENFKNIEWFVLDEQGYMQWAEGAGEEVIGKMLLAIVAAAALTVVVGMIAKPILKKIRNRKFKDLSVAKQEKIRKEYYKTFDVYGEEAKKVLIDYLRVTQPVMVTEDAGWL